MKPNGFSRGDSPVIFYDTSDLVDPQLDTCSSPLMTDVANNFTAWESVTSERRRRPLSPIGDMQILKLFYDTSVDGCCPKSCLIVDTCYHHDRQLLVTQSQNIILWLIYGRPAPTPLLLVCWFWLIRGFGVEPLSLTTPTTQRYPTEVQRIQKFHYIVQRMFIIRIPTWTMTIPQCVHVKTYIHTYLHIKFKSTKFPRKGF